jgi:hypothetical protein
MKRFGAERLLAQVFFKRFFESDLLPGGPQTQLVIWSLAVLAAPGFMMALLLGRNYTHVAAEGRAALMESVLQVQLVYVTYSMIVLGFVALIVWEAVFPDRRDARTLGVLPLPARTHVVGRLAALGAFGALFAVGINLESAVAYALVLWAHDVAPGFLRPATAHLAATALAGLFAFFLVIVAEGVLLNTFGRKGAQRLALALQIVWVLVLLEAMPFVWRTGIDVVASMRAGTPVDGGALLVPPVWFLALNRTLAGMADVLPAEYAVTALAGTMAAAGAAVLLLVGAHGRLVRLALEGQAPGSAGRRRFEPVARALGGLVRHPIERALLGFTMTTLARSRVHLTILATYLGVAGAFIVPALIPLLGTRRAVDDLSRPGLALLSAPLVLYFWAMCAMRALFAIPREIKANWIFRLHARDDRMHRVIGGVRAALLLAVVAPVAMAAGIMGVPLWGARTGAAYAAFTLVAGVLLADLILCGLRKIPFACAYFPGRSRAATRWPLYVLAFTSYAYGLAGLELAALSSPLRLVGLLGGMAGSSFILFRIRRLALRPPPGLTYEETDPDGMFDGFGLSERLAADRSSSARF